MWSSSRSTRIILLFHHSFFKSHYPPTIKHRESNIRVARLPRHQNIREAKLSKKQNNREAYTQGTLKGRRAPWGVLRRRNTVWNPPWSVRDQINCEAKISTKQNHTEWKIPGS